MNSLYKPVRNMALLHSDESEDVVRADLQAQVHPHETNERVVDHAPDSHEITVATPAESLFRHSGWATKRARTIEALQLAGVTPAAMHRFHQCGSAAWVLVEKSDNPRYRVQCERCRNRWCDACAREKRVLLQQNLLAQLPRVRLRFLTLTLKSTDQTAGECVQRLYACFRKLRQRSKIKKLVKGGIAFLELTINHDTRRYHPHLHVIFEGSYLPLDLVRKQWLSVTGDSWIVDVRELPKPEVCVSYVTKYATKAIDSGIWQDPQTFAHVIQELKGTRTLFTFGSWRGMDLLKKPEDSAEWQTLGKLDAIYTRAKNGDTEAQAILAHLGRYVPHADDLHHDDAGCLFDPDG